MRKYIVSIFLFLSAITVFSQTKELASQGWQIQQSALSFDRQTCYFSAKVPGSQQYDLFVCYRDRATWTKPEQLELSSDTQDELWPSISSDEQELYFVRQYVEMNGRKSITKQDIYIAHRMENTWQEAQPLIISDGGSTAPIILQDGISLIYASCNVEPDAKHPHYNLYFARKSDKHNWTLPSLLQENIDVNSVHVTDALLAKVQPKPILTLSGTVSDAISHRAKVATIIVNDAVTLSPIATHRTTTMGTYTIALPKGLNYSLDITAEGYTHRYFDVDCRNLEKDSVVKEDIELTNALVINIHTFDKETSLPLGEKTMKLPIDSSYHIPFEVKGYEANAIDIDTRNAVLLPSSELDLLLTPGKAPLRLRLTDKETGDAITGSVALTNKMRDEELEYGTEALPLRQGDRYEMAINVVGYLYVDTTIVVPLSPNPFEVEMALSPIKQDMVLQLRNIQFEFASSDLKEDSYEELDRVVRLLKDNPSMHIELSAHTDDQGSDKFNLKLSERRGEAAKKYLVRHGIASQRIVSKGYGKTKPLVANDSDENRAINRRVEFKVTEI